VLGGDHEVEPGLPGPRQRLRRSPAAVGVERVDVQVAPVPAGCVAEHPLGPFATRSRRGGRDGGLARAGLDLQLPGEAAGGHPVRAEDHLPGSGGQRSGQVAGGGVGQGDGELGARPTRPAPEPSGGSEHAEVDHAEGAVVPEAHGEPPAAVGDLDRDVDPVGVVGADAAAEGLPSGGGAVVRHGQPGRGRTGGPATGRLTVKVEPRPSSDPTSTLPPWPSATCRTIARPRPVPPVCRARALSTR
jgi:hypothetical protein